jgi:hypothetical protein
MPPLASVFSPSLIAFLHGMEMRECINLEFFCSFLKLTLYKATAIRYFFNELNFKGYNFTDWVVCRRVDSLSLMYMFVVSE